MTDFINTAAIIGEDVLTDSILDGTITEYKENRITLVGDHAFWDCKSLNNVIAPNVADIDASAFEGCSALTTADFATVTNIKRYAFQYCTALTALVIRGGTLCALAATTAFTDTPIASGTGYIYIPAALKDSYAAATNWSTYSAQFRALEDYTVDGTVTGELDETKI
jgi:hypothetical protein